MDTTNVNAGEQSGLKRLLKHAVPLGNLVGFGNHKMALCFRLLFKVFPNAFSVDVTLLAMWKLFHYRPLAINFLRNAAEVYGECHVTPVCPKVAIWTTHDSKQKSLRLMDISKHYMFLQLASLKKKEPYALGIFREISSKRFLATIIVLCDVFNAIQSLNVVLQKDGGSLFFADIPMYLERRSID